MTTVAAYPVSPSMAEVSDFITLLKPRVMTLVVFTGVAGIVLAPGHIHPFLALVAILCIAIASGAAGAINMWYERDTDALMQRTQNRPLPQGRITPGDALAFGVILTVLSVFLMGLALNWMAAALLAAASLFYIFVYTIWLKKRTPQNIVIGGAAGAFPPMIGWAAVTGDVSLAPWMLFALIFFWTPPHFWALALYRNDDYKRANIPMLPVVAGEKVTRLQILLYSLVLTPFALAPYALELAGPVYLAGAIVLHGLFIASAFRVYRETGYTYARRLFGYSIFYLFALFGLMMVT
ncbi:MAG: heme o synthase [Alphaproteobacteria bacterium]|nr:heme o synthase [Alphaproteobacteria bacterium]